MYKSSLPLIEEFWNKNEFQIIELLGKIGKYRNVDCMNLTGFSPITGDMPVYVFVGFNNIVFVLIDWNKKPKKEIAEKKGKNEEPPLFRSGKAKRISPVWRLCKFVEQFYEATKDIIRDKQIFFYRFLITNSDITNKMEMIDIWDEEEILIYDKYGNKPIPYVHYNTRFYSLALSYYKAFRMWCVSQGYLKNDPYAFEDIDADYNEMEYGLDKDDNDISDPEYQQRDLYLIPDESIGLRTTEEDEDDEDY